MEANQLVGPPYAGRPTCLWTHQALPRWHDPCEVSQSQSLPLDHTCVLAQGWKIKSHEASNMTEVANTLHDMWGHLLEASGGA